ncbi:MAG: YggS family pyridoxal phosphate-dependent enzyme, partial [Candidatus Competibacter sp.]
MNSDLPARLTAVLARIRAAERRFERPAGSVRLLAVSKTQT